MSTELGAILWAGMGSYLFFCTGHFCEFAGLQYTAGAAPTPPPARGRLG